MKDVTIDIEPFIDRNELFSVMMNKRRITVREALQIVNYFEKNFYKFLFAFNHSYNQPSINYENDYSVTMENFIRELVIIIQFFNPFNQISMGEYLFCIKIIKNILEKKKLSTVHQADLLDYFDVTFEVILNEMEHYAYG